MCYFPCERGCSPGHLERFRHLRKKTKLKILFCCGNFKVHNLPTSHRPIILLQFLWKIAVSNCFVSAWLSANKLSLNIEKSNFVIFHPSQKRLQDFSFNLSLNNKQLKREFCIKYLGILIDSHLSWKPQVDFVVKKNEKKYWHFI